jgi:predicted nucleotidyltransferase
MVKFADMASEDAGRQARRRQGLTNSDFRVIYKTMKIDEILARLRENETALRARGVKHAALFGSCARGDNRPDSDIDIMVEFDPAAHVTVFNYAGLKDYIAGLFDGPVDVVSREGLKPYVRPAATTDAIYAF